MSETIKTPTWFWVVSVLALVWNLLGVAGYLFEVMAMDAIMESQPAEIQALYESRPAWFTGAFAIAVFSGLLGSIALLIRKSFALILFIISLASIIVSDIYAYGIKQYQTVMGMGVLVMPVIVLLVAIFLVYFSNKAKARGILK